MDLVRRAGQLVAVLTVLAVAAGCAPRREPAPVVFRGTTPTARPAAPAPAQVIEPVALPEPGSLAPDTRGVVDYGGYRAVIARDGDTVASIAARLGISAANLASYNGLPSGHVPRAGDELILPPDAPVQMAAATPTVEAAPLTPPPASETAAPSATATAQPEAAGTFDLSRIERAIDGPSAPDAQPRETPPPPRAETTTVQPPAPEIEAASEPAPQVAALPPEPAAPRPTVTTGRFVRPVSGEIVRPFSREPGAGRSDGVDFAAPAGSEVVAVAPGQVALVSEAIGGNLGTVVLIRHENQVLTVYGRVGNVAVAQGDRVRQGQTIGTVAPGPSGGGDSLHFEVRRGTEPVDPGPFFEG